MLNVEYTLTEEEYQYYNLYTNWLMPEKKMFRIRYYLLVPAFLFIFYLMLFYIIDGNKIKSNSLIISLIVALFLAFFLPYRIKSNFNSRIKKIIEKSGKESILSATQLTIDENGIFGINKVSEVKYKWDAFKKKVVTNNCYYLFTSMIQAVVIPERAFNNKEEKEKFELLLAQYLPLEAEFSSIINK